MIDLDLKDLRRDNLFVIRVYGKQFLKVNSIEQVKGIIKALHVIGVKNINIHIYKISFEKVSDF